MESKGVNDDPHYNEHGNNEKKRKEFWSGRRGSNPDVQLGNMGNVLFSVI